MQHLQFLDYEDYFLSSVEVYQIDDNHNHKKNSIVPYKYH